MAHSERLWCFARIKSFKDLKVWQEASLLAKDIATKLVHSLPRREKYQLGDQITRSSRSVPAQIAEGFRKPSLKDKHRYYSIAYGSNEETENHIIEILNNNYIDKPTFKHFTNRIIKVRILLSRLMKSVRRLIPARKSRNRPQVS